MNNLIPFSPRYAVMATSGLNTPYLVPTEEQILGVFLPLGVQDDEIPEITEDIENALESLDKSYLQENPDVGETLLEKIAELSDSHRRFHVPYELVLNAIQDNPEIVKRLCNMTENDSPREVINEILSSSPLPEDTDDEDDLPLAMAI